MKTKHFVLLYLLFAFASRIHGQTTSTASLTGTVTDPKGAIVVGARVSARDTATGLVQVRTTSNVGAYTFLSLPPGQYEVTCEAAGLARAVVPSLRLSVGQSARLEFALPLAVAKYTVTVSGAAPVLGSQTTNSQVLFRGELDALPLLTRNFVNLTLLTPKVLPASPTDSRGYMGDRYRENQFSFEGVRHQYNYETIDGANATIFITNTLKSFYSLESVQEFRVSNSLWTAEQGHAMGGLVNVVTRSGTESWHGSAYEYFRNDALNEPDLLAVPGFDVFRRNQFGASGGGPIRKEKIYIFSNYEGQRQANTPQLPTVFVQNLPAINVALAGLGFPSETDHVIQTADYDQFLVRTDIVPGTKHRLMLRYNFFNANDLNDRIGAHGQIDDPVTPLGARDQHLRDQGVAGNLFSSLSTSWVNEGGFGFEKHNYSFKPKAGVPPIELSVRGAFATGQNLAELATGERRFHVHDNVSWTRGTHQIKLGVEYIRSDAGQRNGPFSDAIFGPSLLPPSSSGLQSLLSSPPIVIRTIVTSGNLPLGYIFHSDQTGAFIHDQWKVTRKLTLSLGLRYDLEVLSGLTALVDSGRGNLQPRLGFTWSPGARPWIVRGGFGTYTADRYHPLMALESLTHGIGFPGLFNEAFLEANPFAREYRPLPDISSTRVFSGPTALPALLEFASTGTVSASVPSQSIVSVESPNLPNPYATQWGLEIENQIRPDLTIVVGYSGLQGSRFPVGINRNLRPATATLPSGLPDYQGVGPNAAAHLFQPTLGAAYIVEPLGSSLYNAATLTVRKRFAHNYSFTANYVFSKNMDDFGSVDVTVLPVDPYNIHRDWSVSSEHAKHRLVLWLNAEAPKRMPVLGGFGSSVILTLQSPRYYNITAGSDLNHDFNASTDRPDAIGRNTFRGDGYSSVDLRIRRLFRPKEGFQVDVTADFFNLLNRVNVTNFNTVYGQPTLALPPFPSFGTPSAVANAFQTQLGIRMTF